MSPRSADSAPCAHCGAPVQLDARADPDGPHYCCAGCEAVAALVAEQGWDRFYADREGFSPRPASLRTDAFDAETYQAAWVSRCDDGTLEGRFRVSGVRCSACVWLTERVLQSAPGVDDAHVSYGTSMATVRWDPEVTRLSELADAVARLGYTPAEPNAEPHTDRSDLVRLGIAAFCAMNVMLIHVAVYLGEASGMAERYAALFAWASLVLATPAVFVSSVPFFRGSWSALRAGMLSMDVPVAVAIVVMYAHGLWSLRSGEAAYLDSLTMLVAFLLAGRVLVQQGRDRAARAAESVLEAAPRTAMRRTESGVEEVPVALLAVGDVVVAGAGQRVAADGTVAAGTAWVDLSHITGEARPVELRAGEAIPAGASVVSGQIDITVDRTASESTVAKIGQMVRAALDARTPVRALADRIAPWFTLGVLGVASATWFWWSAYAGPERAIAVVVAVLVVACPCALALAAPTTLAVGIGAAARRGAFVRSADALLRLAHVDIVAFDKTGTITEGAPRVTRADDDALTLAAALEIGDRHPVARAIVAEVERRRLPIPRASNVATVEGGGVRGTIAGAEVSVTPDGPNRARVQRDGVVIGTIGLEDCVRADARDTITRLGLPVAILSGDHPETVARVARAVRVDDARGGMRPDDKAQWVASREETSRVLFAGDGLNDAPALARATVGVAMGEGADAAVRTADIVVIEPSLAPIAAALATGRAVDVILRRNARIAVTYNITAVALAAAGLVTPLVAAILMPISSAVVIAGALSVEWRVKRAVDPTPAPRRARRASPRPAPVSP